MKKYRSLFNTIQGIYITLVIVSGILVSLVFGGYIYDESKVEVLNRIERRLGDIDEVIAQYIEELVIVGAALSEDRLLSEAVEGYRSGEIGQIIDSKEMIDYVIENMIKTSSYIDNICVYNKDDIFNYNTYNMHYFNMYYNQIPNETWFGELQRGEMINILVPEYQSFKGNTDEIEQHIIYGIAGQGNQKDKQVIILTINGRRIKKLIQDVAQDEGIHIALVDDKQKDLYKIKIGAVGEGEQVYTVTYPSCIEGWMLVGSISSTELYGRIQGVETRIITVMIGIVLVTIIIGCIVFKSIARPIEELVQGMHEVGNRAFKEVRVQTQYKEVVELTATFNEMMWKIETLIESIKRQEREKRKIEYKVLEAQINPHFMYNTLDAIKWLALMQKAPKVAEMIAELVKLLRYSLSAGKEIVTVESELEHLKSYIQLMEYRNGYPVGVTYEIEGEVLYLYTLKLLLQPFAENCFQHAFDDTCENNQIIVRAYRKENRLVFEIEDNGKGLVNKEISKSNKLFSGIGIENIKERLQLWHGEEADIDIEEGIKGGVSVKIQQPLMKS